MQNNRMKSSLASSSVGTTIPPRRQSTYNHHRASSENNLVADKRTKAGGGGAADQHNEDDGEEENEVEYSMPLLIRKLSVFRKGLVRERHLRMQAESMVDRLKEKLRLLQTNLDETKVRAREEKKQRVTLEKQVATTTEQRTNEKKVDGIFGSFGKKNMNGRENEMLKEKVSQLRRQRNNAGARIEELERQVHEMHEASLTHSELFATVDREMMAKDQTIAAMKVEQSRVSAEMKVHKEEGVLREKERKENEEERERLIEERNEMVEEEKERRRRREEEEEKKERENQGKKKQGLGVDGGSSGSSGSSGGSGSSGSSTQEQHGVSRTTTMTSRGGGEGGEGGDQQQEHIALLEQQLRKMDILKQRASTLERFWIEASQYDAFVVKFDLYKLRKILSRRAATILIRRPIHQRDRSGIEELGGVAMIVTRGGETFVHPAETISEVALLSSDKGSRRSPDERAFKVKYSDGSKTDWFEGTKYMEIIEMLRIALGLSVPLEDQESEEKMEEMERR